MIPAHAGSNTLAIFAILFLLGFGFVVYAIPGSGNVASPSNGSSATVTTGAQGNVVYYHLLEVATTGMEGSDANASGYAGLSIHGQSLSLEWSVTGAVPREQLQLAMKVLSTTSAAASKSFTFATVQVSSRGSAGSTASATLDPGYYSIGLTVVDPSTSSNSTIFTSDPASALVAIASSSTFQTTTATGSSLSYSLVPLPVYLHEEAPSNYPFREGGALIVVSGNQLHVTTSFLGAANTRFLNVIQTTHQNITAGSVTTTPTGGGVFKGNVTLEPGTYQVGLLIYVYGKTDSPVAVSVPRAIEVTLPVTSQTSSSTASTSTTTKSSSTSSTDTTSSSGSTSSSSTDSNGSEPSVAAHDIGFAPITNTAAPKGYSYGEGGGGYAITGGNIYFNLAFTGQNPRTHYNLVLSVNGTIRTIGDYTTGAKGAGIVGASTSLGTGVFVLSLTVVDTTSFGAPTAVLAGVPSSFTVNVHATTTTASTTHTTSSTTRSTTSSATETETPNGPQWNFKLGAAQVQNVPKGYRFATSGTATVSLDTRYSLLNVVIGFQDANPSTEYSAALVLNGTSVDLGSMTTNKGGGAVLHASFQVSPGKYLLGLLVYDVSDIAAFKASGPVLVMLSDPNTQLAVIIPASGEKTSTTSTASSNASQSSSTSQTAVTSTVTKTVTTISAGADVETQIQNAVDSLTIPATVQITPLLSSTTVRDSRFSLSVGPQVGNGIVIGISGENVTGPRVLLINMSRTSPLALYPALNITLDGVAVTEAASALQVLNPTSSDPPRYVLVETASSIQLLVSIPHFSLHLIQVAGELVHNLQASLALDAPLLAGSILVVTLAFAGAYAARKRYFSILL
jgi:trimeric autotransporter adhesin